MIKYYILYTFVLYTYCDVLVGTGSNVVYQLQESNQNLKLISQFNVGLQPSWILPSKSGDYLYATNEGSKGIQSFKINRNQNQSIQLSLLNSVDSTGDSPCHLSIHPNGQFLGVANYGTNYAWFRISNDGSILSPPVIQFPQRQGSGPCKDRQESSHPHQFFVHPAGDYAFISDLGTDNIISYSVNNDQMQLVQELKLQDCSGPRHLVVHPYNDQLLYGINELNSNINLYKISNGYLSLIQSWQANPQVPFQQGQTGAEITTSQNGYLYVSIRGQNTISVFKVQNDGNIIFQQNVSAGGKTPRFITLNQDQSLLYVLHQDSNSIATFKLEQNGNITQKGIILGISSPQSLVFV